MKRTVQNIILIILAALLASAVVWANHRSRLEVCRQVDVVILNDDSATFVTPKGIMRELEAYGLHPEGKLVSSIDTDSMERVLDRCDYLENVECFVSNANHLVVAARQFMPVMRVYDRGSGTVYYVNRNGKHMLVDGRYHIDVPVVEGDFTGKFDPLRLIPLINYVENDTSLVGLVSMYSVRDSNNVCFVPTICGHVVNLGRIEGLDSKFKKLKLFYDKVMSKKGWDAYTEVSLKWDYQVVATLRSRKTPYVAPYNPAEDEQAPPIESIALDEMGIGTGQQTGKSEAGRVVKDAFSKGNP